MSEILIREAIDADAEAIWRLNCEEMGYPFPLEATKANIAKLLRKPSDKIYVAVESDHVIGYVHANDYDLIYAPPMKNILGIAVSGRHTRKGVGKALLQQVESWARDTGATGIRLVSGSMRTTAHAFYHKFGFTGDKAQINMTKPL